MLKKFVSWLPYKLELVNLILTTISNIPIAIWINIITSNERPKWIWGNSFLDLILPVTTLFFLYVQYEFIRKFRSLTLENAQGISQVLSVGVRIFASMAGIEAKKVRGHCHFVEGEYLVPKTYFTFDDEYKDSNLPIPINEDWFIISRAYKGDKVCCHDVKWDQSNLSPLSKEIWPDIQGVIACPIKPLHDTTNPTANREPSLGVISFDSSESFEFMRWGKRKREEINIEPEIQNAMKAIAATVYNLTRKV